MNLILKKDRTIMGGTYILAVDSENNSTDLSFSVEDETLWGKSAFIEFLEQKKTTQGIKVSTTDGTFSYPLPNGLLQEGYVTMQVVIRGENHFVWKSLERIFNVTSAINISADMPVEYPDWLGEAQKILDGAASATGEIDEAVAKADTAVDNANIAIGKADTAIDKANTATVTANTALTNANTAITKANEASDKALSVETEIEGKESLRDTAEQSRVTAEDTRKANEDKRQEDEQTRNDDEDIRKSNETARIADESIRKSNETGRQNNETARKNNELTRQSAETIREENESTRKADETARKNAETSRASAENVRKQNEQDREASEQSRVTAENNRVSAEDNRVAAEKERATAEQARDSAETARKEQFDIWTDDITGMATKAELATETSERKADDNALKYRVKNLESANEGKTYTINTDTTAAYVKNNPDNCLDYGIVSKIYGRDRVCTNLCTNTVSTRNGVLYYMGNFYLKPSTTYTVTIFTNNTNPMDCGYYLTKASDNSVIQPLSASGGSFKNNIVYSFTTDSTISESTLTNFRLNSGGMDNYNGTYAYIMLNKGSTALPYEPYFSGFYNNTVSKVRVSGANLLDEASYISNSNYKNYIDSLAFTGGKIVLTTNSTAAQNTYINAEAYINSKYGVQYGMKIMLKPNTTYTLSGDLFTMYYIGFFDKNDYCIGSDWSAMTSTYVKTFTTPANTTYITLRSQINNSPASTTYTGNIMLNEGSTALTYAAYTESDIDISSLGKTLHGIDLSNSTKCDELDLVNKTYTKRVGSRAYQEGDDEDASVITDGTNTYYILDTPIVSTIPITDDFKFFPSTSLGSLTFENDKQDDVLSEVATEVKVA